MCVVIRVFETATLVSRNLISIYSKSIKNTHILAPLPKVGGIAQKFFLANLVENVILVYTFLVYLLMASGFFFPLL